MVRQCNAHSLNVNTAQRAQERDEEIDVCSELYKSFVLYMLVLQSKYSKFLITIHTVQNYLNKATQGLSTSYESCCRLFETTEVLPFVCIFFPPCSLTGLVRRRTVDQWRRSTASIRMSKRSSVYWRPCSVNNRTQPRPVELTHSGIFIKRTR